MTARLGRETITREDIDDPQETAKPGAVSRWDQDHAEFGPVVEEPSFPIDGSGGCKSAEIEHDDRGGPAP